MRIKEGFMLREVDGTSIVVAVGEKSKTFNGMIKLNSTGSFLWKLLENDISHSQLLERMLEEYDVDEEQARQGIDSFVSKLKENGLLDYEEA